MAFSSKVLVLDSAQKTMLGNVAPALQLRGMGYRGKKTLQSCLPPAVSNRRRTAISSILSRYCQSLIRSTTQSMGLKSCPAREQLSTCAQRFQQYDSCILDSAYQSRPKQPSWAACYFSGSMTYLLRSKTDRCVSSDLAESVGSTARMPASCVCSQPWAQQQQHA